MIKKYNLSEICNLIKLKESLVNNNDISRLDYLIEQMHVLNGKCFENAKFIVNKDNCQVIYNPSQIQEENNHVGLAECILPSDLKNYIKNTVLTIHNYYL